MIKKGLLIAAFVALLAGCGSTVVPTAVPDATPVPVTKAAPPTNTSVSPNATLAPTKAPALGDTQIRSTDSMVMVFVPAGGFLMGSAASDADAFKDEFPQHSVTLDAFWIDQTEVTNAQYQKCVGAGMCAAPLKCDWGDPPYGDAAKADHPVVCVDWTGAQAYCEWVGGRLPTEAEWEYAARGPESPIYPWGDEFDCSRGNFDDETELDDYVVPGGEGCDGYVVTAPVGSFPSGASWVGALDMAGNVWEWVADWYGSDYYASSPEVNPTGPATGKYRVVRGGGWYRHQRHLRAAFRFSDLHPYRYRRRLGFRCVLSPGY